MKSDERIELIKGEKLWEPNRTFDEKLNNGFWDKFIRSGIVLDIGYKGHDNFTPIFRDAIGLDLDTPGYDGKHIPFNDYGVGTVFTSHLLEHIADYGFFLRECFLVLKYHGTLILVVPLMNSYERKPTPPSYYNTDHKRFYTSARLLYEIETSLPRNIYRILHLQELFSLSDLSLHLGSHAAGPYEIECVLEKIKDNALPEDFDPAVYLQIHPDVMASGMDPVYHYIHFGIKENRKYK